jgi:Glycosyl hydrolase family 76
MIRTVTRLHLLPAALITALACAALGCCAPGAAAAAARRQHSASRYPAGATRPAFTASRASLAAAKKKKHKPKAKPKPLLHGDPARGLLAFQAMQSGYYLLGAGLYKGEPFSFLWPFSQGLAATVSLANVPAIAKIPSLRLQLASELKARLVGLHNYYDPNNSGQPEGTFTSALAAYDGTVSAPVGPGGTKYYDDNDWVGIELARLYELSRNPSLLQGAETIMAFEMAGWQTSPELGCPGGLPFSNEAENSQRNTVTTAPAAELATQLYRITHNVQYLQFAVMAYLWVRECLLQPSGLYADHVNRKGVVEPTLWSYNQGTMIGAGTLLYQATGNPGYLFQARQTAKAALAYFTPERLSSEIPAFPSIYFRNLLYLDSVTREPPGPKIAQAYVDYAWQHQRLKNDLFVGGQPAVPQLLVQAAIVQIYALLSSPARSYF